MVSILMPVKNAALYLEECLDSIMSQSYSDWELIAVNDHSTDQSPAVLSRYQKKDQRIRYVDNQGSGIIPALKLAFELSSGQWITRMDADDYMDGQKLEIMVKQLQQSGSGHLAIGQVRYFKEGGIGAGYLAYEQWLNRLTANGNNYQEMYKECCIPSPCWMLGHQDFIACGAFNSDQYPEDYDLAFRFYQQGLSVIPSSQVLHYWRDYDQRTSRTSENYRDNRFLELKLNYFLKLEYNETRNLLLWGAGTKGKILAQKLISQNITFQWICNNPKKIGKDCYGITWLDETEINSSKAPLLIIAVSNKEEQLLIREKLTRWRLSEGTDFFFFC